MAEIEYHADATVDDFVLFNNDVRQIPFWRSLFADGLRLSAFHVTPTSDDKVGEIVQILHKLVLEGMLTTQLRRLWIFMAHDPWQVNNRIVNYRKIWKDISLQSLGWPEDHRGPEVVITSKKGVRYAAVGRVNEANLGDAVNICLTGPFSTFMIASNQDFMSTDATRALFDAIFPFDEQGVPKTIEDWGHLLHQRAACGDVVIKRAGKFDGLEWCLDRMALLFAA